MPSAFSLPAGLDSHRPFVQLDFGWSSNILQSAVNESFYVSLFTQLAADK